MVIGLQSSSNLIIESLTPIFHTFIVTASYFWTPNDPLNLPVYLILSTYVPIQNVLYSFSLNHCFQSCPYLLLPSIYIYMSFLHRELISSSISIFVYNVHISFCTTSLTNCKRPPCSPQKRCRYMAEILLIWHKTLSNQSINQSPQKHFLKIKKLEQIISLDLY